jgi:outer membrane protein
MKNASLVLSILSLVAAITFGVLLLTNGSNKTEAPAEGEATENLASKGDIVYIDLDRILMEYDMANDLRSVVETKAQNIQAEITRRGKKLENEVKSFQEKLNKGLMTRSVAEVQQQKLMQQEQEFNEYAARKEQEINEEQIVMMNQLADAIKTYVDKYNEEKQYAMIITNNGGSPVITAEAALNITEDVLAGLNDEYIKSKNEKSK